MLINKSALSPFRIKHLLSDIDLVVTPVLFPRTKSS